MVSSIFLQVCHFLHTGEFGSAKSLCDDILKRNRDDKDALRAKCFCLIQDSAYSAALQIAERKGMNLDFEQAYCLYRLGEVGEAVQVLERITPGKDHNSTYDIRITLLRAQLLYRLERYSECADTYVELLKSCVIEDYDMELRANITAAFAMAGRQEEGERLMAKLAPLQRHEVSYNEATSMLYKGDFAGAREKLKEAEKLCRADCLEEELDEVEVNDEIGIIVVQLAYLLQVTGRSAEALDMYNAVLTHKPNDKTVSAVATNNILCIHSQKYNRRGHEKDTQEGMLFQAFKRSKTRLSAAAKMTWRQREPIYRNHALLLLRMGKCTQCKSLIDEFLIQRPNNARLVLVNAACLLQSGDENGAEQILSNFLTEYDDHGDEQNALFLVQLALAQLYLLKDDFKKAATLLDSLPSAMRPGLVATRTRVHAAAAATEPSFSCQEEIELNMIQRVEEGIKYWRQRLESTDENECEDAMATMDYDDLEAPSEVVVAAIALLTLTEASAHLLLRKGRSQEAAERFQMLADGLKVMGFSANLLHKLQPNTAKLRFRAHLVAACSLFDADRAERLAQSLPVAEEALDIDPEELERLAAPAQRMALRKEVAAKARAKETAARARKAAEAQRGEGQANLKEIRRSVDPNTKSSKELTERKKASLEKKRKRVLAKRAKLREGYLARLRTRLEETGKIEKGAPLPPCDPERWIARRNRSGWIKGRRRKRGVFARGGQGGNIAEATAKLDARAIALEREARGESVVKQPTGRLIVDSKGPAPKAPKKRGKKKGRKNRSKR
eukprot:g3109.t1